MAKHVKLRSPALVEARASGFKRYFTGKPCKNGHVTERITSSRECVGCLPAKNAAQEAKPDGRRKKATAAWRAKNSGYQNTQRHLDSCARWYQRNKPVARARLARYRATLKQAAPSWLNEQHQSQIEDWYTLAGLLAEETGVPHHVDHVVPLRGKNVSGLHVPWNMQVLTARENLSKCNKFDQEALA